MPSISIERSLHLSPEQMFKLIEDVESYPKFVPGVRAVDDVETDGQGDVRTTSFQARIKFRLLTGKLLVRTIVNHRDRTAQADLVRGPFDMAKGSIVITPRDAGALVKIMGEYATPFARFRKVIEEKAEVLADTVVASAVRYAETTGV